MGLFVSFGNILSYSTYLRSERMSMDSLFAPFAEPRALSCNCGRNPMSLRCLSTSPTGCCHQLTHCPIYQRKTWVPSFPPSSMLLSLSWVTSGAMKWPLGYLYCSTKPLFFFSISPRFLAMGPGSSHHC